jgi:hypothetical protein
MTTEIDQDAAVILGVLSRAPRSKYVAASAIARDTDLSPDRVNDATAMLVEMGLVEWHQFFGTSPFDFGDAMITARGRRECQRMSTVAESRPSQSGVMGPSTIRLFVSHSSADTELARRLVILISTALNVPASAIRCTSVDGYRLPGGANTDEQLRREVHESTAFVGILSLSSVRSMYVLFELGARWGAGRSLIPLLARGLSSSVMKGPLSGINALQADNRSQLHQLVQDLGQQLSLTPQSPAVFERALQEVLDTPIPADNTTTTASVGASRSADDLPRGADEVLLALANEDGQTAESLATVQSLSLTKTEYLLDSLEERRFVSRVDMVDAPSEYYLQKEGRRYIIERGLIA